MKSLMKKFRILLGFEEVERKWWDEDPLYTIQGPALAEALRHAHRAGRAAA